MAGTNQRLMLQYQGALSLLALFYALIDTPSLATSLALQSLYTRLDIDLSSGIQLDRIGSIVGRPRPNSLTALPVVEANLFTWDSTDSNKWWDAGLWKGEDEFPPMSDVDYRLLLKGVIFGQNNLPTIHNIERFGVSVLGVPFLVRDFVGRVEAISPYELSPTAIQVSKESITVAQGVELDLYMGPNRALGEIFELDSSESNRGLDAGYWAILV